MPLLEMVTPEQFSLLRDHFSRTGFTEAAIRERLGFKPGRDLDLVGVSQRPPVKLAPTDGLNGLILLFILGDALPTAEAAAFFPAAVREALSRTKLLLPDPADANRTLATAALYPIRDLFIASDRWAEADHSPREPFSDIVYPALTKSAKQFIDYTSFEPCEDFLELCAGTAPAALLAARSAKNVWATDIAERSVDFAKFNAALNGIHNVTIVLGDLYEPVGKRTFDRITAHPPYVPVLKPAEIFYGGGETGEEITKRVISELPTRLKPGGTFNCRTLGTERPGHAFERRVREWLGDRESEFDIGLFAFQIIEPRQFALEETLNRNGGKEQYAQWEQMFQRNDIRELVMGILLIQRNAGARPAFTIRRTIRGGTSLAVVEWAMRWEAELQTEGAVQRIFEAKPVATQGTEITVRHILRDGEISPESFTLSIEYPFAADCKVQPWMAMLLPKCDGKTTVAELFEVAKQNGFIVPETPPDEFCRLFGTLISGGFLQTEAFKLPAAAK
jgi:methylase of polypeptide subunit release factors